MTMMTALLGLLVWGQIKAEGKLERMEFNHPGLVTDLAVGLWSFPLPMDVDNDGDIDLAVSCPDAPYNGVWVFENLGKQANGEWLFKAGRKSGPGAFNLSVSRVGGRDRVLGPGVEYPDLLARGAAGGKKLGLPENIHPNRVRHNQWRLADLDGDGASDLLVGVEDWTDYGWDRAFDSLGNWTRGPLRGLVYLARNEGTDAEPKWGKPALLEAGGKRLETFGLPSPSAADYDGDGDLDLVCGEFLDGFTWFENIGDAKKPRFAPGKRLLDAQGKPHRMHLEMIVVQAVDFDRDGRTDLVVGQEDGRVALMRHSGAMREGMPVFEAPRFFRQQAGPLKFGALATPVLFDWDGDGDADIVSGNTAGEIGLLENLGGSPPKWAAPKLLEAGGEVIRIEAGPNGSVQGPAEARWGYTTLSVADWNMDELPDLVVNSIWGKVVWFRNNGSRKQPRLAKAEPIRVAWSGEAKHPRWNWWKPKDGELATQWRTTPLVHDVDSDGKPDLVCLDHEGYLACFRQVERDGRRMVLPGDRLFEGAGPSVYNSKGDAVGKGPGPLRLNNQEGGGSGRRKLSLADWDGDGQLDLLVNSVNASWLRNKGCPGAWVFEDRGPMDTRKLAGHDTSPTVGDVDGDGKRDLLVGAEDGHFYWMRGR